MSKKKRQERKKKRKDRRANRRKKLTIAVLQPFKRRMAKALDARHLSHTNTLRNIAENYYHAIVLGKYTYGLNDDKQDADAENITHGAEAGIRAGVSGGMDVGADVKLVTAIIKFIKDLINRRKKGETMTEEEKAMADHAEKVDEHVDINDHAEDADGGKENFIQRGLRLFHSNPLVR